MAEELTYKSEAAAGYDRAFAPITSHFVPFLLRAAHIAPGMRVLDIAAGTGLAAEAALGIVGPTGHVTAADFSPAMVEKARERLAQAKNASVAVEDGQALSFSDRTFDAVVCSLGLMFFPNPSRGLAEFHRVLRPGGRAAVSVNTVPERSYNTRINLAIVRYVPSLAEAAARVFSLGDEKKLRLLFEAAAFQDVEITTEIHRFALPSFDVTSSPLSKARGRPGRHLCRYPRMPVTQFVRKCGATSATRADQSRLRWNTGLGAGDVNRSGRHPSNSRMSALGQKRTYAAHKPMSALPPKADMCGALAHVCFGPKADICSAKSHVRFAPDSDRESGFPRKVMSALPPKADMCGAMAHVCYGPEADIATAEHMIIVGPCDNRLGALLTVSERAICPVAKGAVEIALAGAITLAQPSPRH